MSSVNPLFVMITGVVLALRIIKEIQRLTAKPDPTVKQYIVRLTEYYDEPDFSAAVRHYVQLVETGVDAGHAFNMVTQRSIYD